MTRISLSCFEDAWRRLSRRDWVAWRLTFIPRSKLASEPEDMMPWKMKIASRGSEDEISLLNDVVSARSALIELALDGFFARAGTGGSTTSVRIS